MAIETLTAETASEYDFIIGLDASGSMGQPSTRFSGKTRWEEMQESVFGIAAAVEKFDADGIDIVTFGPGSELFEGVTSAKVLEIFNMRGPRGTTPLHLAVDTIIQKQKASGKNTVAIIFTDGAPDNQKSVADLITNASNALERDEQLTFLFVQIGSDAGATAYLNHLDDQLQGKFDIVDTVTAEAADQMEPLDLITKAIND